MTIQVSVLGDIVYVEIYGSPRASSLLQVVAWVGGVAVRWVGIAVAV